MVLPSVASEHEQGEHNKDRRHRKTEEDGCDGEDIPAIQDAPDCQAVQSERHDENHQTSDRELGSFHGVSLSSIGVHIRITLTDTIEIYEINSPISRGDSMAADPTEDIRRNLPAEINAQPGSREYLEAKHGQVWDTAELDRDFIVIGFAAPWSSSNARATA